MYSVLVWQIVVKMHVMIGISVGFYDFYVTYDTNIIRQALKKTPAHGKCFPSLGVHPP